MFKSFALVAIAALTLAACSKTEAPINDENDLITLKFNIKNVDDASTRALLGTENGKNFLNWEDGDKIGTYSVGTFSTDAVSNNNPGTVSVSGDSYTLNVQTYKAGSITEIYSYFPHSAAAGKDKTAAIVTIPETQTMTNSGFDADAMPMAGTPVTVNVTTTEANTDTPCGTINFSNLGSIIKFRVYSSGSTNETLTSVTYKATGIGGSFSIDLTGIDAANESSLELTASNVIDEITTSVAGSPAISGLDNAIDVYMVVAPGDYTGSQVVVTTNAHTYTLDASGTKTFTRSHVKPIKVDLENGVQGNLPTPETWTKVTSASDFTAGTYYILRGDGAYYLPNAVASSGAPACVAYTASASIPNAMRWTATAGTNGLVFESATNAGKYLWGWGKNDGIRITDSSPASGASKEWSFETLTVSGTTYYTASAVSGRYLISYGTQDWRNYQSASATNIPAEFYKLDVVDNTPRFSVQSPLAATAAEDTYEITVTRTNYSGAITVTVPSGCDWVDADDVAANATSFDILVSENTGSARSVTLTLSATGVDSQELVINQAGNEGTAANPYTAAQAAAAASSGATGVYVRGIISAITTAYNSTYNNVSFDISDDGLTTSTQFRIFRASANSADDFKVGDAVTFMGDLTVYGSTPELDSGNTLISQLHAPTISPDADSFNTSTQDVTITADSGSEIRYTIDGTAPTATSGTVYSSAFSITETTTVKAIAVKNGVVTGVVSKTYTKVSISSVTVEYVFNTDAGLTALGISKPDASEGTNLGDSEYTVGAITMTATSGSTPTRVWNGGSATDLRIYKNGTLTFSTSTGNIKSIVLSGGTVGGFTASPGSFSSGTWTGSATSVTLTATATEKINTISVTYE